MNNKPMQLVYTKTQEPVIVGDVVQDFRGEWVEVVSFQKPHKHSSQGKIILQDRSLTKTQRERYVSVIGAEWINRDDRSENVNLFG